MDNRHQFRANWHDYNDGIFFITICAAQMKHLFGSIYNEKFIPSELGDLVDKHIQSLPGHYHNVEIWNYVIMPNHIHMVVFIGTINEVGTRLMASAPEITKKLVAYNLLGIPNRHLTIIITAVWLQL